MLRLSVTLLLTYNGISRFLFNTHNVLTSTLHFTIRILRILLDLVTTFASPFAQLLKKKKKIQTSKEHSHDHDRFFVWKTSGPLTLRSPLDYRLFVIFNATNANNVNDSFEQTASYQIYASTFSWINYKITNKNREKTLYRFIDRLLFSLILSSIFFFYHRITKIFIVSFDFRRKVILFVSFSLDFQFYKIRFV